MKLIKIDHFVLTVSSISKAINFYKNILGLKVKKFKKDRFAIYIGKQKINLHKLDSNITPKAKNPSLGVVDVCFITKTTLKKINKKLKKSKIKPILSNVKRSGTKKSLLSTYIHDFDGNLIEIANEI